MYQKETTVAFSGHRSGRLPITAEGREALRQRIDEEIDKAINDGYRTFIMGACFGFDLIAAGLVLQRRKVISAVDPVKTKLIAAVPHEHQAIHWKTADRELYYNTLAECDEVVTLKTHYTQGCFHERNRWMVDRSSRLICFYDGGGGGTGYTIDYALQNKLEVINLYEKA